MFRLTACVLLLLGSAVTTSAFAANISGLYQAVVSRDGDLLVSFNSGLNWTVPGGAESLSSTCEFQAVAISAYGEYFLAASDSTFAGAGIVFSSSTYGTSWTDITQLVAPGSSGTVSFKGAALSETGQYQAVASNGLRQTGGPIYVSSDFGATWHASSAPLADWWAVSMSSSGQFQTAVAEGNVAIMYSWDYGMTWNASNAPQGNWWSVCVSSLGKFQVASIGYGGGLVYTSSDYGATWLSVSALPNMLWFSVRMSMDGRYIGLAGTASTGGTVGDLYLSSDFGASWTTVQVLQGQMWTSLAISATGETMVAVSGSTSPVSLDGNADHDQSGLVFRSSDYGVTWSSADTVNTDWYAVAVNF